MPFIDVSMKARNGGSVAKFKVEAEVTDLFKTVVAKAITKYLQKTSSDELPIVAVRRIRSVECNEYDFEDELESTTATIEALNSDNTPILAAGFNIELNPLPKETENESNKKMRCSRAILLKQVAVELKYFEADKEAEEEEDIMDRPF